MTGDISPWSGTHARGRFNLTLLPFTSKATKKFTQEHALGTAQGEHLMAIEYSRTPAPRLCQNTFRMAGKEMTRWPFLRSNLHIEFGPQLRKIVLLIRPKAREEFSCCPMKPDANPQKMEPRNLPFTRERRDGKRWPERSVMSNFLSQGVNEIQSESGCFEFPSDWNRTSLVARCPRSAKHEHQEPTSSRCHTFEDNAGLGRVGYRAHISRATRRGN